MRGSIVKRSRTSWALVVDQGRDPSGRRKQKWVPFKVPRNVTQREAHKQAEKKLAELLTELDKGTFIDPQKTTLVDYLRDWHAKKVVPNRRPETARTYTNMIGHVSRHAVGALPLQRVRATDLEALYAALPLGASSVKVCHAVIRHALSKAVRDKLLAANPADAVERPKVSKDRSHQGADEHCWSAEQARAVLAAARDAGTQVHAFLTLALHTGARKGELLGLTWAHVDLDAGTVTIAQQLEPGDSERPEFGPTKTKQARTLPLHADAVAALRTHRTRQLELRLANGAAYRNYDLVFAKEPTDLLRPPAKLGQPHRALADRHFKQVIRAAGVRPIRFHGCRHTAATLLLAEGEPVHVVADRLGHAETSTTLRTYAHVLQEMRKGAAHSIGAVLTGR